MSCVHLTVQRSSLAFSLSSVSGVLISVTTLAMIASNGISTMSVFITMIQCLRFTFVDVLAVSFQSSSTPSWLAGAGV